MKQTLRLKGLLLLCMLGLGGFSFGQDIHFSQLNFSPLNLNPALAGVFQGNMRFAGAYRSQWQSVPVPYMTFSAGFDANYYNRRKWKDSVFGGGLVFHYDQAGDGEMSLAQVSFAGSYTRRMSKQNFLSAGIMGSFSQRSLNLNDLSFDMQFDGELFDPTLTTGEDFINSNVFFSDFTVGVNWHHQQPKKRMRLDFGAALFHINQPNTSFMEEGGVDLDQRISVYGFGEMLAAEKIDFLFRTMGQFQGEYREIIFSAGARFHIDQTRTKELALALNLGYRLDDAFVPAVELDYKSWRFAFSYDVNLSSFTEATSFKGGPELSVMYFYRKVLPLETYKACPIF